MNDKEIAVLNEKIENIEERITELAGNYKAIQKSYSVLNEHHHQLELDMTAHTTKLNTVVGLVKWLISPAMVIALLLQLAQATKVI